MKFLFLICAKWFWATVFIETFKLLLRKYRRKTNCVYAIFLMRLLFLSSTGLLVDELKKNYCIVCDINQKYHFIILNINKWSKQIIGVDLMTRFYSFYLPNFNTVITVVWVFKVFRCFYAIGIFLFFRYII